MIENIKISFQGIWTHKLRSLLTMLGIIIGIAAIIAIVSTIKGTSEQIKQNLVGSGNNTVEIPLYNGDWQYVSGDQSLAVEIPAIDESIKSEILDIDEVESVATYRMGQIYNRITQGTSYIDYATILGIDMDYFNVMGYRVVSGRIFTDRDYSGFSKCVILDTVMAQSLFEGQDPVGGTIEIMNEPYVVIGVVEKSNEFEPVIDSLDEWYTYYSEDTVGKIYTTDVVWPMMFSFDEPYNVVIKATETETMTKAGKKTS
ncbi:MAG: ABC transporter permease, partial [Wujia sp.]